MDKKNKLVYDALSVKVVEISASNVLCQSSNPLEGYDDEELS